MDGNGRWAENRGLMRFEGHRAGVKTVKLITQTCLDMQIPVLSLFAFSSENWLRPEAEVEFLMLLFLETLRTEVDKLHENKICLRFIGERRSLSTAIQDQMAYAEQLTHHNSGLTLNLAINYGGRWDITQAARRIAEDAKQGKINPEDINEKTIDQYLDSVNLPDPDLFIRTSGETRVSNFFLWQLAYTELYFTKTLWPDFTKDEFLQALTNFHERERRYGKTSQQILGTEHV